MPDKVLTARMYFPEEGGHAENAYNHLVGLMQHAVEAGRVIGQHVDTSWVRLHECYAAEDDGDTSRCVTLELEVMGGTPESGDEWTTGVSYEVGDTVIYDGTTWECLTTHTSQEGWEPGNAPSLWEVAG